MKLNYAFICCLGLAADLELAPSVQAQTQQNGLLREVYENIGGTTLADLTNNAAYPGSPTSENIVTDYFESPTDVMEDYGQRMRGLILPPTTGNYTFWIATDDAGGLYLSTDENPANIRAIAWVNGWAPPRNWTVEASQKSTAIRLEAGKRYYIEALMKEGNGGDNLAVRWQLPDGTMEEPIPASRLLVYGLGAPSITGQPQNYSVLEGDYATFSVQVSRITGTLFQWKRNGADIAGATNNTLSYGPVVLTDNGSRFSCGATNAQGGVLSAEAVLSVLPDSTLPTVDSVFNLGSRQAVTILFSEPVEEATALNPSNYTIDNGISVQGARFAGDTRSVLLQTTPLKSGTTYTLTVNGVKDRASTPNVIAPNTRRTFRLEIKPLDIAAITGTAEPLGPSNRRWGVVVSEIMYHPADRADTNNLQYVEIFNTFDWPEDISGWRLSGSINYTFSAGTILPKRGFLVVAPSPEGIKAVYGINNVVGGFSDKLPNDSGTIRVRNANDSVIFDASYSSKPPFPVAADGAGHSLVLWRPSYGEGQPEAWAASEQIGGSPGVAEPAANAQFRTVMINEILAHTDDPQVDFVELFNYSTQAVSIAGCVLTDNAATNKFAIPAGTVIPPMGFVSFDQNQLGFALDSRGETLCLFNPAHTRVIDALHFTARANGVAYGRYPDGSPDFHELTAPTPGSDNSGLLIRDIVINELMYDPISGDSDDEYIELYNKGSAAADLSRWRFVDGINFDFPDGTAIPAGGCLVVAKNAAHLLASYPNLNSSNTVGGYQGTLANGGERVALAMPHPSLFTNVNNEIVTEYIYVVVDEVAYHQGGRWPRWAGGGGSSLELIDSRADNRRAANWADSDETGKSGWTTVQWTGVLDNGNGGYPPNQLQMFMLGDGECLVDDVEVIKGSGNNLLSNPSFANGLTSWTLQGNHKTSFLESAGGVNNSACLHVVAAGRGDTGANRIRTPITGLAAGDTATLRAKVRWLKGWPEFLIRTRGNWLEAAGALSTPRNLGTPGARNSRAAANVGPAVYSVAHSPVLPSAGQAVTVRARVDDPDDLASVVVYYRVDPATNYTALGMSYNGAGYYSATLPGQTANATAAFFLQLADTAAAPATTLFPNDAPKRECLIRWGESKSSGNFGSYRLWLTQKTVQTWASREKLNNASLDATFVYGDSRVIYNIGALYAGSPFLSPGYNSPVGNLCGYVFEFPEDDLCLNTTDFTLDWPIRDGTAQVEPVALWMVDQLGAHGGYRRPVNLFVNGNRRGTIFEDCLQPNGDVVKELYPDDADGNLHKTDDWFEFDDAGAGFSNVDATLQNFTTTGGAKKLARYRWNWRPRAVRRSASEFTPLFALVDALNTSDNTQYTAKVNALVDVADWMRVFAIEHIMVNWDSYGFNRGKNMYAYKPQNGKWVMMPWDIDFSMGDVNQDLFATGDPTISRMYNHPPFRRAYLQALQDAANGPMASGKVNPLMDAKYAGLTANGISVSAPTDAKNWIAQRRTVVLSVVNRYQALFALTSNGGQNFNTNLSLINLSGTAPLAVRKITLNGIEYPLTWTTVSNWSARVTLQPGANAFTVQGYDRLGNPYAGGQASITINYTGATDSPVGRLVINEIMYHPTAPGAAFLELFNNSTTTSFDLSRWRLNGVDYTFPDGTLLGPQNYLVIAENPLNFAAAYGSNIPIVGAFSGQLDHGGETLGLIKPGVTNTEDLVIDQVAYNDAAPWPKAADGQGPSLQLIDPAQDNRRVGNWAASATNASVRYTPGAVNSVKASLPAFPEVWLNEIQPENLTGPADAQGHREPWIELFNSSSQALDLGGLYLTDNYTNLTQWAFPASTILSGQSFLLVWADGKPQETTVNELHTNFRIAPGTGTVALVQITSQNPVICDYLNYRYVTAGRSYGAYPDGQPRERQVFHYPTPGGANNPASAPLKVVINEWMASNTRTLADPADGHYEDWFELYNAGTELADLSRYTLTDTVTNSAKFMIPDGTVLRAGDYLMVWADEDTGQNIPGGTNLHANFKLGQAGEMIGLFAPDGALVDVVNFGTQTNDVSEGRWPDGAVEPFFFMDLPTPGAANMVASSNLPPVLTVITNLAINEGQTAAFQASATDANADQTLRFSLGTGAPSTAAIDAVTGAFSWTTAEADGPGTYMVTVRVSDNGAPVLSASKRVAITVNEINTKPALPVIEDQTVDEGQRLNLIITAADSDLPPQTMNYSVEPGGPGGITIDANTGEFSFTPTEDQGPGTYTVTIKATDNASAPLSDSRSFQITVREINRQPSLQPIANQVVVEGETLSFRASARDDDIPAQQLAFSLDPGYPAGASLNTASGDFTWTPSASYVPSTNFVVIRVTDTGNPPMSDSRTVQIIATKLNHPPVLASIADQNVDEGASLRVQMSASDSDAGQTLSYSLEPGAPKGMIVDAVSGWLTWIPDESMGPGTYTVNATVTDSGLPAFSNSKSFSVTVREVNSAPVLNPIPDQSVYGGNALSLMLTAVDPDIPTNTLTFALASAAPQGMTLNAASGVMSWTPSANQIPSTNTVTVTVTDNGTPALSDTKTFTVVVSGAPPWQYFTATGTASSSSLYIYLTEPGELYLDDLKIVSGTQPDIGSNVVNNGDFESALTGPWTVSANHADSAIVTNVAHSGRSSLRVVASSGGTTRGSSIWQDISPTLTASGNYALSFWCLPSANAANMIIRLSGFGISATNTITAVASNQPPSLAAIGNQQALPGQLVTLQASASDPDSGQSLGYSLAPDAPAGAAIDPVTGVFTWTPSPNQSGKTSRIAVRVVDNGYPLRSDTEVFLVVVNGVANDFRIVDIDTGTGNGVTLQWEAQSGGTYQVQCADQLSQPQWINLGQPVNATGSAASYTDQPLTNSVRYYRVLRLP